MNKELMSSVSGAESAPPRTNSPLGRRILTCCAVTFALLFVVALALYSVYGADTHHANHAGIWWPERAQQLIPPAATDITLQRDFLDHYAVYTISEKELNAFLDVRFADGSALDSFSERKAVAPGEIGKPIGRLGWVVTKDTVVYRYSASNGASSSFYHDSNTGLTYQSSAYW